MTATSSAPPLRSVDLVATLRRSLDGVLQALDDLVASADPAVVFASVVRACVPTVCAAATIRPIRIGNRACQLSFDSVFTQIRVGPVDGMASYQAVLQLRFDDRRPGSDEVAVGQIVVDRAARSSIGSAPPPAPPKFGRRSTRSTGHSTAAGR